MVTALHKSINSQSSHHRDSIANIHNQQQSPLPIACPKKQPKTLSGKHLSEYRGVAFRRCRPECDRTPHEKI
ncbi:MAG: hypothetical protein ACBR21_09935 [Microcoleus sp.]